MGLAADDAASSVDLPALGRPTRPDVGDHPQFESEPALFSRLAELGEPRRLSRRRLEVDVSQSAASASGDGRSLVVLGQIGQNLARLVVPNHGSDRHVDEQVFAVLPVSLLAAAGTAMLGLEPGRELERQEAGQVGFGPEIDRSATAPVAAVRTSSRHVLFAPERGGPVSAVAGFDPNSGAIDEHVVPSLSAIGMSVVG